MNVVVIKDKDKAEMLINMGFKHYEVDNGNEKIFNFYATNELINTLNTKFAYGDYVVSKLCYM